MADELEDQGAGRTAIKRLVDEVSVRTPEMKGVKSQLDMKNKLRSSQSFANISLPSMSARYLHV